MKGVILGERFDTIVYGSQTAFIKIFPTTRIIVHSKDGEILPFKMDVHGKPGLALKPHFRLGEQFFIKEPWQVASIISFNERPRLNGSKAILYSNDLNPVHSRGQMFSNVNTFLFNHAMQSDESIPGVEMKATVQYSEATMPCWAARYHLRIIAAGYIRIQELTLQQLINGTGKEDITIEDFLDSWNLRVRKGHQWSQNPVVGYYEFEIGELNNYVPS